jgi:hypothetical protein
MTVAQDCPRGSRYDHCSHQNVPFIRDNPGAYLSPTDQLILRSESR